MVVFTYKDYLRYANLEKFCIREETEKYILDKKQEEKTHQYSDKIFKEILSNKKEFITFLQKYINQIEFKNLTEDNLEKCDKEFITSRFKKKESDIIYKITNRNIYIIVEHQSKIDYEMSERMTEYCVELMRNIRKNNINEKRVNPIILPIVLYTGNQKWDVKYKTQGIKKYEYKIFEYTEYNLIDINSFTKEELIEETTGLSKALLFEKIESKEELKNAMNKILKKNLTSEEVEYIQIMFMYSNKIKEFLPEGREQYIKKLEEGGREDMRFEKYFIEWLQDEKREGRREGRKEGRKEGEKIGEKIGLAKAIRQMVKEMLKNNITDEQIMKITKIDKDELEKLKTT